MLWLDGPSTEGPDSDNPLMLLAGKIINATDENHLNIISYFCEIPRYADRAVSREIQALVALLYALIRQLIELLPPRFSSIVDFSEERFLGLEGTLESWEEALHVFRDLLELVPGSVLFCVIDGLHVLDYKTIEKPLALLLGQLRHTNNKLRVLFTTSGRSYCLGREMKFNESVVIEGYHGNTYVAL